IYGNGNHRQISSIQRSEAKTEDPFLLRDFEDTYQEIAIKPNGKTVVSSAIPRSQSSSAHGDDVMFFRDVTMRPHQEELRFRLIHFWEARNPNTKTLTGVEMLLIDEQDSPVPFQEDWFRFRSHEEFEANCDLKVDLYDYLGHMKLVNEQPLTDCPILNGVDIAKKRHLRRTIDETIHMGQSCSRFLPEVQVIWEDSKCYFSHHIESKTDWRNPCSDYYVIFTGFLWTLMSNQQEIILAGMLGSNSDIAWKINAEIVTKHVAIAWFECTATINHVFSGSAWYYISYGVCHTIS
ncbi:hypothetical protein HID58_077758, partial [Brassica napus]